jgi:predicted helicase
MTIKQYIESINKRFQLGNATEHTFRGDLQNLIENLIPKIKATNEPKRQQCGAPDYIITRNEIPVGFIEAKDIGDRDLTGSQKTGNKEQFDRYKASLDNLIITDYITFLFYRNGQFVNEIAVGQLMGNSIKAQPQNFEAFTKLLTDFCIYHGQTITSPRKLAELMAGKARLLADIIQRALEDDDATNEDSTLHDQMLAFKEILIHDITPQAFADVYAQTIAYGMFAARLHDQSLDSFSRREAAELIPKSNPFLRKLFGYIAGPDIDDRIVWIVDHLAEIFMACDVKELLKDYGKETMQEDPIIHFYETFLSQYDAKLRKARGVWYTPKPVVSFIVRAIDQILKDEFDLPMGLADNSKIKIKVDQLGKKVEKDVHRVQILDPATGTGTFLVEIVKEIHKKFAGQQGIWNDYVENHLVPRLNGFELLMASYAMAHLKLEMLLKETGWKPDRNQRLRIYLTNSLEESHPDTGTLFANWLSQEANEANHIKRDTPVMVITGNPPYSVSSNNKSKWIEKLIADYKKDLNERNIQPLSDDYIKFIRFGQHFIDKNGSGILAYISNNSFIDGIIHRQVRRSLLQSFDKIYILDLHGSAKKNELSPDGSSDENVFDIQQGVSINIFVKTGRKSNLSLGKLLTYDLYGKRDKKYEILNSYELESLNWNDIENFEPNYFFVDKNYDGKIEYTEGFSMSDLFKIGSSGIKTERDILVVQFSKKELESITDELIQSDVEEFRKKHNLSIDGRDWKLHLAKEDLVKSKKILTELHYRPFDFRFTYYTGNTKGFQAYPRKEISDNIIDRDNIGLINLRQNNVGKEYVILVTNKMTEKGSLVCGNYFINPLYIYTERAEQITIDHLPIRSPNFNFNITNKIEKGIGLSFTSEKVDVPGTFAPIDLLDYIYAVLHSPAYREKYKEFLKIDFPRVPYPTDQAEFWRLVALGGKLRQLHLMESPVLNNLITQYPEGGDNEVTKVKYENGKVHINEKQYFANVPEIAWEFYIGGYQPAQKWLKDRKGRKLIFEDILHYQKIIVALVETDRVMKEIDNVENK